MNKIIMAVCLSAAVMSSGCIASGVGYLQDRKQAAFRFEQMGNGGMLTFDVGDYFSQKPKKAWGLALLDLAIDGGLYALVKEKTDWLDNDKDKDQNKPQSEAVKDRDLALSQQGNGNRADLTYTFVPGDKGEKPTAVINQVGDNNVANVTIGPVVEE